MKENINIRFLGLLSALILLIWNANGQSLVKQSIGGGAGRSSSGTNTLVVSSPFFSTAKGTSSSGAIEPGFLSGIAIACVPPPKPTITISNGNTATPILTSSATVDNQWFLNGSAISGATGNTLPITGEGVYSVQVGSAGCVSAMSNNFAIVITGDSSASTRSIMVYPNPAENYFEVIGLKSEFPKASMIDMSGKGIPISLQKGSEVHRADISNLPMGIYLLRIAENDSFYQIKILKK